MDIALVGEHFRPVWNFFVPHWRELLLPAAFVLFFNAVTNFDKWEADYPGTEHTYEQFSRVQEEYVRVRADQEAEPRLICDVS